MHHGGLLVQWCPHRHAWLRRSLDDRLPPHSAFSGQCLPVVCVAHPAGGIRIARRPIPRPPTPLHLADSRGRRWTGAALASRLPVVPIAQPPRHVRLEAPLLCALPRRRHRWAHPALAALPLRVVLHAQPSCFVQPAAQRAEPRWTRRPLLVVPTAHPLRVVLGLAFRAQPHRPRLPLQGAPPQSGVMLRAQPLAQPDETVAPLIPTGLLRHRCPRIRW